MEKYFLKNVYGYKAIKEELYLIYSWYKDYQNDEKLKNILPRGIIFNGAPGVGKTYLMKEYSKIFNYPVFVIEGNSDNPQDEVISIYKKASQEKNAIVIIDELEKLIEKDTQLTRILMTELDGFNTTHNILTLATCNSLSDIPEPLLREGRFDRDFYLSSTNKDDLEEVIKGIIKDIGINIQNNDIDELIDLFNGEYISKIKASFNDAYLRFGKNATIQDIINSNEYSRNGYLENKANFNVKRHVAIHEAGHSLYAYYYSKNIKFLRVFMINENEGKTIGVSEKSFDPYKRYLEDLRISLAGLTAEEICLKKHNVGSSNDLDKAYDLAFRLMNRSCVNGIENLCDFKNYYNDDKNCPEKQKKIWNKKARKFLMKNYKIVKKDLKKHKNEIIELADYLIENKQIIRSDFINEVWKKSNINHLKTNSILSDGLCLKSIKFKKGD